MAAETKMMVRSDSRSGSPYLSNHVTKTLSGQHRKKWKKRITKVYKRFKKVYNSIRKMDKEQGGNHDQSIH